MSPTPRAAVGTSENPEAFAGGAEAARKALDALGEGAAPHLVFLFSTSRLAADALTKGVRSVFGEKVPIFGSNANGVISNDFIGYDGFQAGVAALYLPGVDVRLLHHTGIAFNEAAAGDALGQALAESIAQMANPLLFFLYDSVNRLKNWFIMNLATPLLGAMSAHLKPWPPGAGARVMGDMKFNPTTQWCDKAILENSAVALLLSGAIKVHTRVLHGCRPTSAYHRVTKADGATVLEIDGQSALQLIGDILGPELRDDFQQYKFFVTFGINHGPKWEAFKGDHYANRMCVNVDVARGGLVMAESLPEGTVFQIMQRNFDMQYNLRETRALLDAAEADGGIPFFAFYINCAGRAAAYYGSEEEEADYVMRGIEGRVPLLGIYEAGEIAQVHGEIQLLDWSGVLNILSYQP